MNRKEYRERQERDCFNCVHKHPDGNCGSWDCEYINRREAIEAWRAMKGEQIETVIRCRDCKYAEEKR